MVFYYVFGDSRCHGPEMTDRRVVKRKTESDADTWPKWYMECPHCGHFGDAQCGCSLTYGMPSLDDPSLSKKKKKKRTKK